MVFRHAMRLAQQLEDSKQLSSSTSSKLEFEFEFDFEFQYMDDPQTLTVRFERFHEIKSCDRNEILSENIGPNILCGLLTDIVPHIFSSPAITELFLRTLVIPDILSFARAAHAAPRNRGHQQVKLRVKLRVQWVDEVIAQPLNFTPANTSSIRAMKRTRYGGDDDDDDYDDVVSNKRRRVGEPTMEKNLQKECSICLSEFSDGEEIAWIPCGHAYHDGCIVRWLETSRYCPLCRYQMPS